MVKVAVLDDYQDIARESADWESLAPECEVVFFHRHLSEQEMADQLQDFDIIIGQRERIAYPRSLLVRLPNLKLIMSNGRLNPYLDLRTAQEMGIKAVNSGAFPQRDPNAPRGIGFLGLAGGTVGELTLALMISVMRRIPQEIQSVRNGGWQTASGPSLANKTLGIVGLGSIGAGVARLGNVFGMEVIAWSQNLTPERAAEAGATAVGKDDLFRRSDVITVHYAMSERSLNIVGAHEISLMKPTAYLINTSRGPVVDEPALIEALQQRRIAGAGLDVFVDEPPAPGHPFRTLDNVVATPHIGYVTDDGNVGFHQGNLRTLKAYLAGEPLDEYKLDSFSFFD